MITKKNNGIELLRIVLSFLIVANHFWHGGPFLWQYLKSIAVPSFMLISFYLMGKYFEEAAELNIDYYKKRLERLLIPFWGWGILYFVIVSIYTKEVDFGSLILQLLFGHTVCTPLYFIFCLLIIFTLFYILKQCKLNISVYLVVLFILCYFLQYSGANYSIFNSFPNSLKFSFGRLAELIPSAIMGIYLYQYTQKNADYVYISYVISIGMIIIGLLVEYFSSINGYGYHGVEKLFGAVGVTCIFIYLPLNSERVSNIRKISSLTLGVYCIHLIIGEIVNIFLDKVLLGSFFGLAFRNIVIFMLSLVVSYAISILPIKNIKKLVS